MKQLIKQEMAGWKSLEIFLTITACVAVLAIGVINGDALIGCVSAVTGVLCVITTGKGKLSTYFFGLINCILYSILAYNAKLYGIALLNSTYFLIMQFVGFFIWQKHMNDKTNEVSKRRLPWKMRVVLVVLMAVVTYLFGMLLMHWGDAMPFVDAFTTIGSIVAMIISVLMYSEQWYIWVLSDACNLYMWYCNLQSGGSDTAVFAMRVISLVCSIAMLVKWEKEANGYATI
jgi:nicotinamide mononucleotide transporter